MKFFEKENQKKSISPLNDNRFYCQAWGGNPQNKLCIFIKRSAYEKVLNHAEAHLSEEVGGILIGRYCEDKNMEFLEITDVIEATTGRGSSSTFTFTHESWNQVYSEIDKRESNEVIVGWYHTHPEMGIFLSRDDNFIHTHFFTAPWQVALVVDPIRKEEGFFRYENDKKQKYQGFYIYEEKENIENIYKFMGRLEERIKHKGQEISLTYQPLEHRNGRNSIVTPHSVMKGAGEKPIGYPTSSPGIGSNFIQPLTPIIILIIIWVVGMVAVISFVWMWGWTIGMLVLLLVLLIVLYVMGYYLIFKVWMLISNLYISNF